MLKHVGIATLAVGLLACTTVLAEDHHPPPSGRAHSESSSPTMGGGMSHMGLSGMRKNEGAVPTATPSRMDAFHGSEAAHSGRVIESHHAQIGMRAGHRARAQRLAAGDFGSTGNHRTSAREEHATRYENTSNTEHAAPSYRGGTPNYGHTANGYGRRPSNWNHPPRRFDRGAYQHNYTAQHRLHYGSYRRPAGWYYRRWTYGEFLPRIFWARNYWLTDWWLFDLPIPPYGHVWVRYGDDALLINTFTGEILEVEYAVFY